ncbi:MAG: PQQ-binding-like beta-propeller repeat protein, partial [Chloroflexota bacterium]|nr:PQQ-binding-like beta-propeller repeat protein [Chloroflexota bacterium]
MLHMVRLIGLGISLAILTACSPQDVLTPVAEIVSTPTLYSFPTPDSKIVLLRGDPQQTGVFPFPGMQTQPEVQWQVRVDRTLLTPPLLVDDMLYTGSFGGNVYALDAETGQEIWSAGGFGHLESTGAIAGELIISGGYSKLVRALDRHTGEEHWSFTSGYPMQGAPLIVDDRVFIATDRAVYALDLESGQPVWETSTGDEEAYMGAPAYEAGVLYTTSGRQLIALDSETGNELWQVEKDETFLSLAVADQHVYVGNWDRSFYAFDAFTGEERWVFQADGEIWSPPAVDKGIVYAGNSDRMLYALDARTGELRWSFETDGQYVSGPMIADGVLYVSDSNHDVRRGPRHLYALAAATGEQLWMFETVGTFLPAPALGEDKLYVIAEGDVLALE